MATDPSPLDVVADPSATDPLSEVTRNERKALLGACIIAVSIAAGGLVPEKIEALGITVTSAQEKSLLYILAGILVYFVIGFSIYAWADLNRRRVTIAQARRRVAPVIDEAIRLSKEAEDSLKDVEALLKDERFKRMAALSDQVKLARHVSSVGALRVLFDVWLPVLIGVASTIIVLSRTRGFPGWPWVTAAVGTAGVVTLGIFTWRRRNALSQWRKRQKGKWQGWRFKRLMAEANRLPDDSPRKAQLLGKARESLMRSIEDFAPTRDSEQAPRLRPDRRAKRR